MRVVNRNAVPLDSENTERFDERGFSCGELYTLLHELPLLQSQPLQCSAAQELFFGGIVPRHAFDQGSGLQFAERERVICTKRDALRAEEFHDVLQDLGIVHQGVYPKLAQVFAGVHVVVHSAKVRAYIEAVFYAADGGRERSTAVCKGYAQFRQALQHTTEDH